MMFPLYRSHLFYHGKKQGWDSIRSPDKEFISFIYQCMACNSFMLPSCLQNLTYTSGDFGDQNSGERALCTTNGQSRLTGKIEECIAKTSVRGTLASFHAFFCLLHVC